MNSALNRRTLLQHGAFAAAALGAGLTDPRTAFAETTMPAPTFRYCLNTSTIRGQELGLVRNLEIAAEAGYDGVEPWIREIDDYVAGGGSLRDLRQRIADLGLSVESAIGFAQWIVDDDAARAQGLAEARRTMDLVAALGGTRIAAPPAGATDQAGLNLLAVAQRFAALLQLGQECGVQPMLEVWGFSQTLSRLGEVLYVAAETQRSDARLLLDVYHLYKGGSEFAGLQLVSGAAMPVWHVNDYPAAPPRAEIKDEHRVFPGDGVAPLGEILRTLTGNGFAGVLSLELFNREYWTRDPLSVAREGLEKTRAAVQAALG